MASEGTVAGGFEWRVPTLIWGVLLVMLCAAYAAYALIPRHSVADDKPEVKLEALLPKAFGDWREDPSWAHLLVDPTLQQKLDVLYTQTLNRAYVGKNGERVMLSIAYGRNQNTESTAAHRPEFCYTAQGWVVNRIGLGRVDLDKHHINVVHLDARAGNLRQPISYWVTLNDEASIPGFQRKIKQLKYGLQGLIVDGMLVRVSTQRSGEDPRGLDADFAVQDRFLRDMEQAIPASSRSRFFGS